MNGRRTAPPPTDAEPDSKERLTTPAILVDADGNSTEGVWYDLLGFGVVEEWESQSGMT